MLLAAGMKNMTEVDLDDKQTHTHKTESHRLGFVDLATQHYNHGLKYFHAAALLF